MITHHEALMTAGGALNGISAKALAQQSYRQPPFGTHTQSDIVRIIVQANSARTLGSPTVIYGVAILPGEAK